MANWALLSLISFVTGDGFLIEAKTDVQCHLWLRYSKNYPEIHKIPVLVRGITIKQDVRFCHDVYHDNEQFQSGDTLTHTFLKESWPCDELRYYYFWGTIAGQYSPSNTAIFDDKRVCPPPSPEQIDGYAGISAHMMTISVNNLHAETFITTQAYYLNRILVRLNRVDFHAGNLACEIHPTIGGQPSAAVIRSKTIPINSIPVDPTVFWGEFIFSPGAIIHPGVLYCIVLRSDHPGGGGAPYGRYDSFLAPPSGHRFFSPDAGGNWTSLPGVYIYHYLYGVPQPQL